MKGVIIEYNEQKRYGFIMGEDYSNRFFHLNQIINKNIEVLINNEVEFVPSFNEKGLIAVNINQIGVFSLINKNKYKAFVLGVNRNDEFIQGSSCIVSGIKQGQTIPSMPGKKWAVWGGNGTFRVGYPEFDRKLELKMKIIGIKNNILIDIRDIVLEVNERQKITEKLIEQLNFDLSNKIITVVYVNGRWELDDPDIMVIGSYTNVKTFDEYNKQQEIINNARKNIKSIRTQLIIDLLSALALSRNIITSHYLITYNDKYSVSVTFLGNVINSIEYCEYFDIFDIIENNQSIRECKLKLSDYYQKFEHLSSKKPDRYALVYNYLSYCNIHIALKCLILFVRFRCRYIDNIELNKDIIEEIKDIVNSLIQYEHEMFK
jgi:cold shock CspA family protein